MSFCPWDYIRQIIEAHKVHQLIELYGQSERVPSSAGVYRKAAKWGTVLLNVGSGGFSQNLLATCLRYTY